MAVYAAYMLGRCANGAERDKGRIIHARDGWIALCGRQPGRRSAGWSQQPLGLADINCPKCLSRMFREGIRCAKKGV